MDSFLLIIRNLVFLVIFTLSCSGSPIQDIDADHNIDGDQQSDVETEASVTCDGEITIETPSEGYLYIDGRYSGVTVPGTTSIPLGQHRIGVGVIGGSYYYREIDVREDTCIIVFTTNDILEPRIWRALWIGVPQAQAEVEGELCETSLNEEELDAAFEFYTSSVEDHFEPYSFHTFQWEIDRRDTTQPVDVTEGKYWYDIQPNDLGEILDDVEPGDYDTIFVFWKGQGDGCVIPGEYLGLGWNPNADAKFAGFVSVKFETNDIYWYIDYFVNNDPGVWIHEWLHTVCEAFYYFRNVPLPYVHNQGVVHTAEEYGYEFPWMTWYEDLIGGRVPSDEGYLGIGPETLSRCTVRQEAVDLGTCDLP